MASPAYELSTDANGNTILVPATTPASKPRGFFGDVASKAKEYFSPRVSDLTEGTAATYGAGRDISQRGYENFKTNPLYGAGQVIGGSALSAISPLAGATEYFTKPVGRTLGPAPEHAAEIASMFTPLPSKGASMLRPRPKAAPASELANIPREFSYLPRDMQETINAMPAADREQVFAVLRAEAQPPAATARAAAPSASSEAVETAKSISPVDLAVQQNRNPGRFVNPETGMPQSVRDPLTGQMRPAMGAIHDPFEALAQRVSEMPGPVDYLTKPRPVINPDTGYQLQQIMPNGKFGPGRTEFTPGQRVAQAGVVGGVGVPIIMGANSEANRRENQSMVDAALKRADGSISGEEYGGRYNQALRDGTISGEGYGDRYDRAMSDGSITGETYGVGAMPRNVMPPQRPAEFMAARPVPSPPEKPAEFREPPGILSRIFSGQDYQSKGGELRQDGKINWGDPESAADFFRASKALQETPEAVGMKRGGAVGKPDSVHKALEIIHHLLTRSH
jgi:hypothetical protein